MKTSSSLVLVATVVSILARQLSLGLETTETAASRRRVRPTPLVAPSAPIVQSSSSSASTVINENDEVIMINATTSEIQIENNLDCENKTASSTNENSQNTTTTTTYDDDGSEYKNTTSPAQSTDSPSDPKSDVCVSIVAVAGTPDPEYNNSLFLDNYYHDQDENYLDYRDQNYHYLAIDKPTNATTTTTTTTTTTSTTTTTTTTTRSLKRRRKRISTKIYTDLESFECITQDGNYIPIHGTENQLNLLRTLLNNGEFVSGKMTIDGIVIMPGTGTGIGTGGLGDDYLVSDEMISEITSGGHYFGEDLGNDYLRSGGRGSGGVSVVKAWLPPPFATGMGIGPDGGGSDSGGSGGIENEGFILKPSIILDSDTIRANGSSRTRTRRKLGKFEGVKQVLVVRVIDSEGRVHPDSAAVMSDKIFGTAGDSENMAQQFWDCSFGKLKMTYHSTDNIQSQLSAPGVIEVTIPVPLTEAVRSVLRNEITMAVEAKLGFELPNNFDHVMYVIERCYVDCGWAAYAYVNSWNSIYQRNYYRFPGVQLHELGHNLNLGHSGGLDGFKTYSDHTCLMGNPLYSDSKSKMCFNPAKSYQISAGGEWYDESYFKTWNVLGKRNKIWKGRLVGVADYLNISEGDFLGIKLETGTKDDYYIGFNRAHGVTADNKQAGDQVTIIQTGNDGLSYSQSWLIATLRQGDTYTFRRWRGRARNLIVRVNEIDITDSNPGFADVTLRCVKVKVVNPTLTTPAPVVATTPSIAAPSRESPQERNPPAATTPKPTRKRRKKKKIQTD